MITRDAEVENRKIVECLILGYFARHNYEKCISSMFSDSTVLKFTQSVSEVNTCLHGKNLEELIRDVNVIGLCEIPESFFNFGLKLKQLSNEFASLTSANYHSSDTQQILYGRRVPPRRSYCVDLNRTPISDVVVQKALERSSENSCETTTTGVRAINSESSSIRRKCPAPVSTETKRKELLKVVVEPVVHTAQHLIDCNASSEHSDSHSNPSLCVEDSIIGSLDHFISNEHFEELLESIAREMPLDDFLDANHLQSEIGRIEGIAGDSALLQDQVDQEPRTRKLCVPTLENFENAFSSQNLSNIPLGPATPSDSPHCLNSSDRESHYNDFEVNLPVFNSKVKDKAYSTNQFLGTLQSDLSIPNQSSELSVECLSLSDQAASPNRNEKDSHKSKANEMMISKSPKAMDHCATFQNQTLETASEDSVQEIASNIRQNDDNHFEKIIAPNPLSKKLDFNRSVLNQPRKHTTKWTTSKECSINLSKKNDGTSERQVCAFAPLIAADNHSTPKSDISFSKKKFLKKISDSKSRIRHAIASSNEAENITISEKLAEFPLPSLQNVGSKIPLDSDGSAEDFEASGMQNHIETGGSKSFITSQCKREGYDCSTSSRKLRSGNDGAISVSYISERVLEGNLAKCNESKCDRRRKSPANTMRDVHVVKVHHPEIRTKMKVVDQRNNTCEKIAYSGESSRESLSNFPVQFTKKSVPCAKLSKQASKSSDFSRKHRSDSRMSYQTKIDEEIREGKGNERKRPLLKHELPREEFEKSPKPFEKERKRLRKVDKGKVELPDIKQSESALKKSNWISLSENRPKCDSEVERLSSPHDSSLCKDVKRGSLNMNAKSMEDLFGECSDDRSTKNQSKAGNSNNKSVATVSAHSTATAVECEVGRTRGCMRKDGVKKLPKLVHNENERIDHVFDDILANFTRLKRLDASSNDYCKADEAIQSENVQLRQEESISTPQSSTSSKQVDSDILVKSGVNTDRENLLVGGLHSARVGMVLEKAMRFRIKADLEVRLREQGGTAASQRVSSPITHKCDRSSSIVFSKIVPTSQQPTKSTNTSTSIRKDITLSKNILDSKAHKSAGSKHDRAREPYSQQKAHHVEGNVPMYALLTAPSDIRQIEISPQIFEPVNYTASFSESSCSGGYNRSHLSPKRRKFITDSVHCGLPNMYEKVEKY